MRLSRTGRNLGLAIAAGPLVLLAACHPGGLTVITGALVFSSPDQPADLTQPDAGVVQIALGQARVGSTKTLTLAFASIGSAVTLGGVDAGQPDSEFSLPFVPGTLVQASPSQITVSFTPTSAGDKSAVFELTAFAPAPETVLFELSGEGVPNELGVAPNPVDFGQVEINQVQSVSLTVTNDSPLAESFVLSPLQGPNADRFSLGAPSSTAIAPGGSATLEVAFAPLVDGPASASFTVTGGAASEPLTVNLAGIGIDEWIEVASPLDFGFVQIGDTVVKPAVVKNMSQYTTLHLVAPGPALIQPSGPFTLAPAAAKVPVAIPPGQSVQLPVTFTPGGLRAFSATLDLTTDDPLGKFPVVEVQGYGGGPSISCSPSLSFGPVAVGSSKTEDVLCTNSGTEIPSLPKLALQIAQQDLGTDSSAFVPYLVLRDGGLADSGYSVSLLPGGQARIRVAFHPEDAGPFESRLTVPSNDIYDLDAGTILLAEGGLSEPCDLEVTPTQLNFGEVLSGEREVLQFELSNTSQAFCNITRVSLDPGSNRAFSLPDGGFGPLVLTYAGSTDTPALSSSVFLEAEYTPTTQEAAATGKIDIALNAVPPDQSIALTGISQPACLRIEPPDLDFGLVGFNATYGICFPDSKSLLAINACAAPVTVSHIDLVPQIDVSSGLDSAPQFALQNVPQLPLSIAPGGQASFQVGFVPTSVGAKTGAITAASSEFPNDPFFIPLQGDAEVFPTRTDTFTVPPLAKQVDLLWVLDEDDDYQQVQAVAAVLPQLIDTMNADQLDYQMAVTSTDTCDAGGSDLGFFEPCDHCISTTSSNPLFITPTTPDPSGTLADLFALFDVAPQLNFCKSVNGDEHFFDSIADALSPALLGGHNSGFIRDGADLAVVLINGDAEDDGRGGGIDARYLTTLAQVTATVQGLKADPTKVSVSYINSGAGTLNAGQQIGELVEATGGIEIDTSAPADVWQASLLDLFAFTEGEGAFHLALMPTSVASIQVSVNGVPSNDWTYDSGSNQIIFTAGQLPPQGATVSVTYGLGC